MNVEQKKNAIFIIIITINSCFIDTHQPQNEVLHDFIELDWCNIIKKKNIINV